MGARDGPAQVIWRRRHADPVPVGVMEHDMRSMVRIGVITILLSLVPLGIFGVMLRKDLALRDGPRATARVVEVLHLRETSKGPPETSSLRVRFTTAEGEDVVATLRTTRRTVSVGDAVRLSYDNDNPKKVRAAAGSEFAWRIPLIAVATFWFFAGCAFWVAFTLKIGRPSRTYQPSKKALETARAGNSVPRQ